MVLVRVPPVVSARRVAPVASVASVASAVLVALPVVRAGPRVRPVLPATAARVVWPVPVAQAATVSRVRRVPMVLLRGPLVVPVQQAATVAPAARVAPGVPAVLPVV